MTDDSPPPLSGCAGDIIGGKYRLDACLAEGGMGVVWRATHLDLDCPVAIKLIRPDQSGNDAVVARLLAEARIAASLRGRHVNRVLDVGKTHGGTPYLVLEYLHGCDLGAHLEQQGRLSVAEAADYVLQACAGLAEAHAASIVHRDLKPENLFLSQEADGSVVIKVLDFGISKAPEARRGGRMLTNPFEIMGSPSYMSPEQIRSGTVDLRSDIWALGAVLYELCSGEPLFDAPTVTATFAKILDPKWRLPRMADVTPSAFYAVVQRCLQKDARDRYQSVAELARELSPLSGDATRAPRIERVAAMALHRSELPKTPVAVTTTRVSEMTPQRVSVLPRWRGTRLAALAASPLLLLALGAAARPFFTRGSAQPALVANAQALPLPPIATPTATPLVSISPHVPAPAPLPSVAPPSAVVPRVVEPARVWPRAVVAVVPQREPEPVVLASVPAAEASVAHQPSTPLPTPPLTPSQHPSASAPDAWDPETFGGRR